MHASTGLQSKTALPLRTTTIHQNQVINSNIKFNDVVIVFIVAVIVVVVILVNMVVVVPLNASLQSDV